MLRLIMSHNQEQFEGAGTYMSVYTFTGENYIASLRIQGIQPLAWDLLPCSLADIYSCLGSTAV